MTYYAGLDVSLIEVSICVVDEDGEVVTQGTAPVDPEGVAGWFKNRSLTPKRIIHESGQLSIWLQRGMVQLGLPAICIDARKAHKSLSARMNKSDSAPIDPDKIFLFGHSNGAIYAQILLNRTQGPWRAAALHAGFAPAKALIAPATAKPIKLYLGDEDHIFSMAAARLSGKASAARGHDFDLVQIQGHNHWFYAAGPKIAADSWAWMAALTVPELAAPVTN